MKHCTKCGGEYPYSHFHKDVSTSDGYRYWCKKCVSAYMKGYRKERNLTVRFKQLKANARRSGRKVLFSAAQFSLFAPSNITCIDCNKTSGWVDEDRKDILTLYPCVVDGFEVLCLEGSDVVCFSCCSRRRRNEVLTP